MLLSHYISHFFKAKRRHGVHSPFAYDFSDQIMGLYPIWNFSFSENKRRKTAQTLMNLSQLFIKHYAKDHFKPEEEPMISIIYNLPPDGFRPQPLVFYIIVQAPELVGAKKWEDWKQRSRFKMVLDCWHIALFSNHPVFKDKQTILLK